MEADITTLIRGERKLSFSEKLLAAFRLSVPAMIAMLTSILMQYIDVAMVGSLGAEASASIGAVETTTWFFGSIVNSAIYGFSVQIAHAVGAGNGDRAKNIYRQGFKVILLISCLLSVAGILISGKLPVWLGADEVLHRDASLYFLIFIGFIPLRALGLYTAASLQATGDMKVPGFLESAMCILDVIFNFFMIFPTRSISLMQDGFNVMIPGAGLGVPGAALGTVESEIVISAILIIYAAIRKKSPLKVDFSKKTPVEKKTLKKWFKISGPAALESSVLHVAMIVSTGIVAPLGSVALAANSFAVVVEGLCYMPAYGLQSAALTLTGQSLGAGRRDLAGSFAWITVGLGMTMMTVSAVFMFFFCPYIFNILTPDDGVRSLGAQILRLELVAEPFYGASIIAAGALRGAGDTLASSILTLISLWGVRIILSLILVGSMGLVGVWIAMCVELVFRGTIFMIRQGWIFRKKPE